MFKVLANIVGRVDLYLILIEFRAILLLHSIKKNSEIPFQNSRVFSSKALVQ